MKLLTLLGLLALCMLATTAVGQKAKKEGAIIQKEGAIIKDGIAYDMNLQKSFPIKLKGVKLEQGRERTTEGATLITLTLEFTNNTQKSYLSSLRKLFAGEQTSSGTQLRCNFFDEDGVVFTKLPPGKMEGEVSGMKGDAFRMSLSVPNAVLAKTKSISIREEEISLREEKNKKKE